MIERTQKTYRGWGARLILERARLRTMMNGSKRLVVIIPGHPGFVEDWNVEELPDRVRLTQWLGNLTLNILR